MSRWNLVLLALAIGLAVVTAENILSAVLTGNPLKFSADAELVYVGLAAAPYVVLALAGVRRRLPWLVGLGLTLSLWGSALYGGVSYEWNPDGSGADIMSGLLMLALPFVFTPILLAVAVIQKRDLAKR